MGMGKERETLFGKPHIGECWYTPAGVHKRARNSMCVICGRQAQSAHHIVPKGMGGGSKYLTVDGKRLMSPLIAVCGTDNVTGCHGGFHQGDLKLRWEFYDKEPEEKPEPYSDEWYRYGYYVLSVKNELEVYIGREEGEDVRISCSPFNQGSRELWIPPF